MSTKKEVPDSALDALKEALRSKPELFDRISEIVGLSEIPDDGASVTINDIEEALIPKIRQLGNETLRTLTVALESKGADDLKRSDPTAQQREKKD